MLKYLALSYSDFLLITVHCSSIVNFFFFFFILTNSLFSPFSLLFPFSLLSSHSHAFICSWWFANGCGPPMVVVRWDDLILWVWVCGSRFMGLGYVVWFHGSGFSVLISTGWFDFVTWWVCGSLTGMGISLEGRSVWVIELIGVGLWSLWWSLELWWLVAADG